MQTAKGVNLTTHYSQQIQTNIADTPAACSCRQLAPNSRQCPGGTTAPTIPLAVLAQKKNQFCERLRDGQGPANGSHDCVKCFAAFALAIRALELFEGSGDIHCPLKLGPKSCWTFITHSGSCRCDERSRQQSGHHQIYM